MEADTGFGRRECPVVGVCIVTGYGINADEELAEAFRRAGGWVREHHLHDLLATPTLLAGYRILGIPGGFSFGDHLGSGKVSAFHLRRRLLPQIRSFVEAGGLVIGICNGFQVLVKSGLLPDLQGKQLPEVSLVHNDTGVFQDRWVTIRANPASHSPWLQGVGTIEVPIRHGEGRFVTAGDAVRRTLQAANLIAFTYEGKNPNGSEDAIAGITDRTGRILGLMPHPEAFLSPLNHPTWTRGQVDAGRAAAIFRNAVEFVGVRRNK